MKKKTSLRQILLLVYLLACFTTQAQTFIKRFAVEQTATVASSFEIRHNKIFVTGVVADTSIPFGLKSFIAQFDSMGELVNYFTIKPNGIKQFACSFKNSMISTRDAGFALIGYAIDSIDSMHIAFLKYDSNGYYQFQKMYDIYPSRYASGLKLVQNQDESYFIVGDIQYLNYQSNVFLLKIDAVGQLVFSKRYANFPLELNGARGITKLNDSTLLVSIGSTDGNDAQAWVSKVATCFLVLDTSGNQKRFFITADSNTIASINIRTTYDGKYLSCGAYFDDRVQGLGYRYRNYVVKWDTSFNEIWNVKTGAISPLTDYIDFEQTSSNDIVLSGMQCCDSSDGGKKNGTLSKVSKDGTLLWQRNYRGITSTNLGSEYNILTDVDLMPNGDIVATGECDGDIPDDNIGQYGWIIRVHGDGCMDDSLGVGGTWCGFNGIDEPDIEMSQSKDAIRIYPNPSQGIFTIYSKIDLPPATTIQVFDVNGKQLTRQPLFNQTNLLNLHHLSNGIYFYEVGNNLQKVQSGKLVIQK